MIVHVVLFKLKDNIRSNAQDLAAALVDRLAVLPMVDSVEGGANTRSHDRAYDVAIIVRMTDRQSLERYLANPQHRAAAADIVSSSDSILNVDYETT